MIAGESDTQLQKHEIFEYKTYMLRASTIVVLFF